MANELKTPPRFKGKAIELQTGTLIIPPLPFKILKQGIATKKLAGIMTAFMNIQQNMNFDIPEQVFQDAIDLAYMAAKRNYPDLDIEIFEEGLDFDAFVAIAPVLLTLNNAQAAEEQGKNV